jgi:hypothetical protein
VLAGFGSGVATKTCKLTTVSMREVLTRLDATTWTANVGPRGVCNASLILTLQRDGGSGLFWNYKQIRSVPDSERGPLCSGMDRVSVSEWRWNGRKAARLGCEYID